MNCNIFTSRMKGKWITQSSNYLSLHNKHYASKTLANQIDWIYLSNYDKYINFIEQNIYTGSLDYFSLYRINYINQKYLHKIHYAVLLKEKEHPAYLLKFNETFNLINRFLIQYYSEDNICLISRIKDVTIIEKIYFLNTNVKVIKSIIKKDNQYIATSFSSEIKIS